jgi:hypothetical protein
MYVAMTNSELLCYSDNPATQNFSRVNILASYSLKDCVISDASSSGNPKAFDVISNRDQRSLEFICPTNSVKFQWVKHLQVQTSMAAPPPVGAGGVQRYNQAGVQNPAVPRSSPVHMMSGAGVQQVSKLTASRNLAAKVLTPVPRISYNTSLLDHSAVPGNTGTVSLLNNYVGCLTLSVLYYVLFRARQQRQIRGRGDAEVDSRKLRQQQA